jgi:multiple sugar transport system substrate-binding protein
VRDDQLSAAGLETPQTWDQVLELARALPGRVAFPLYPTDAICSVLTLCASLGAPAAHGDRCFPDRAVGEHALGLLADLAPSLHVESLAFNPPRAFDRMQQTDEILYVPLAFGYTNYSRPSGHRIRFLAPPSFPGHPVRSLLGGAGIAVSASSRHGGEAAAFSAWVCGAEAQARIVFPAGGQPASRTAWVDPELDAASGGFFRGTLGTMETAHVRPRAPWWPPFQEEAGLVVASFLADGGRPAGAVEELERLFARARERAERRAA